MPTWTCILFMVVKVDHSKNTQTLLTTTAYPGDFGQVQIIISIIVSESDRRYIQPKIEANYRKQTKEVDDNINRL